MRTPTPLANVRTLCFFILIFGLVYGLLCTFDIRNTSLASSAALQKNERVLKHHRFPTEPIKIVHVKNLRKELALERKFVEEDDWLKDLTIFVKNTSDKPITFISMELHFIKKGASEDEPIYAHQLFYNPPFAPQEPIAPKAIGQIKLTDDDYELINQTLAQDNYPSGATEVEINFYEVRFNDGTSWKSGQFHDHTSIDRQGGGHTPSQNQIPKFEHPVKNAIPILNVDILSFGFSARPQTQQCGVPATDTPIYCCLNHRRQLFSMSGRKRLCSDYQYTAP